MTAKTDLKPLLVTTIYRGVFFGYGKPGFEENIELKDAKMCIYWSADMKGVFGLAALGPSSTCKIGTKVSSLLLRGVASIAEVSEEAAKKWEEAK